MRGAVLQASLELLAEVGYERMSIEEVASRAGVHKTTVYRRWSTKAELVLDAARVSSEQNVPIPDTGTLHGDLRELARGIVANIGTEAGGRRTRSVVAAAASSTELAASMEVFWRERFELTSPIVERAIRRGELPPSTDPMLLVETLIGPMWVRLLLTGGIIDGDLADRVAAFVAGCASDTQTDDPGASRNPPTSG